MEAERHVQEGGACCPYGGAYRRTRRAWDDAGGQREALPYRPVRIKNFAAMRLDWHLVKQHERHWVLFGAAETKSHVPYEAVVSHPTQLLCTVRVLALTRTGLAPAWIRSAYPDAPRKILDSL
jgi:hypothetical protein